MLRKLYTILRDCRTAVFLLKFMYRGYLYDIGWTRSKSVNQSIDMNGNPIPWLTYPFLTFLSGRLNNSMTLFEYGSGNSTLYYATVVKSVFSVENNSEWYNYLMPKLPANVKLFLRTNGPEEYVHCIREVEQFFQVVIVDGRYRVDCIKEAINLLTEDGVIILDNSNRKKYSDGVNFLTMNGFRKIDFWGIAPSAPNYTCTTVFYRDGNVLGI